MLACCARAAVLVCLTILYKSQVLFNVPVSVCLAWIWNWFSDSHGRQARPLSQHSGNFCNILNPFLTIQFTVFLQYLVKILIFCGFFFRLHFFFKCLGEMRLTANQNACSASDNSRVSAGRECLGDKAYGDGFEFVRLLLVDCFWSELTQYCFAAQ